MSFVLAILSNPVITKPLSKLLGRIFRGGDAKDKVTAPTVAVTVLTVFVAIAKQIDPDFGAVIEQNVTIEMVGGVAAAVVAILGYFQTETVE